MIIKSEHGILLRDGDIRQSSRRRLHSNGVIVHHLTIFLLFHRYIRHASCFSSHSCTNACLSSSDEHYQNGQYDECHHCHYHNYGHENIFHLKKYYKMLRLTVFLIAWQSDEYSFVVYGVIKYFLFLKNEKCRITVLRNMRHSFNLLPLLTTHAIT